MRPSAMTATIQTEKVSEQVATENFCRNTHTHTHTHARTLVRDCGLAWFFQLKPSAFHSGCVDQLPQCDWL